MLTGWRYFASAATAVASRSMTSYPALLPTFLPPNWSALIGWHGSTAVASRTAGAVNRAQKWGINDQNTRTVIYEWPLACAACALTCSCTLTDLPAVYAVSAHRSAGQVCACRSVWRPSLCTLSPIRSAGGRSGAYHRDPDGAVHRSELDPHDLQPLPRRDRH